VGASRTDKKLFMISNSSVLKTYKVKMDTQENFSCQNTKIDPLQHHREASRSSIRLQLSVNPSKRLRLIGDIKVTLRGYL
jgi:hypothetical protein